MLKRPLCVTIAQPNEVRLYRASGASISRERIEHIARAKRVYRQKREKAMKEKTIKELAVDLTVEATFACDQIKGKTVFTNQLLRSCSSIGANAHEAKYAQSKADFISKLEIALKECYETEYWLELLYKIGALDPMRYSELNEMCGTIRRKLIASVTTAKKN